jgi:hypothetical protein
MTLLWIISYFDGAAPLIPLFIFVLKKAVLKEYLFLFLYLSICCLFNTAANILADLSVTNYFIFQMSLPLSFSATLVFFNSERAVLRLPGRFLLLGAAVLAGCVFSPLLSGKLNSFNSICFLAVSMFIIATCLIYYWKHIQHNGEADIFREPLFWVMSGFFIYHSSSFIVFAFYEYLIETQNKLAGFVWTIQNFFMLIMCILISKGILCRAKQQTQSF